MYDADLNKSRESEQYIFKDYTESEIHSIVRAYVQEAINLADMGDEVFIKGIKLYGSRTRDDFLSGSDLDVLIEYEGDYKEYMLFNLLHDEDEPLLIDDILIDINPIRAEESGTIEEYYARVCDFRKREKESDIKPLLDDRISAAAKRAKNTSVEKEPYINER